MNDETLKRALTFYGVQFTHILPSQSGYRNCAYPVKTADGPMLNFVLFKQEPGIVARVKRTDAVAAYLHGEGMPTRIRADARILRLGNNRYAGLYYYLPGETIPWEAYNMAHLKLLGKTMSDMHAALADYPAATAVPDVITEYQAIYGRMRRYFQDARVLDAIESKLQVRLTQTTVDESLVLLASLRYLKPTQVLHMDFVRSNVLFAGGVDSPLHISGILDLEKTARGHVVFDIARTLAFLLVDCKYKPADKIYKYFLQSGYQKYGAAAFANVKITQRGHTIDALESLVTMFLLHDFYKFLKHNPYEYLHQNQHYTRTIQLLIERGTLHLL